MTHHEGSSGGKLERRKWFSSSYLGFLLLKFLVLEVQGIRSQKAYTHIAKKIFWKIFVQHSVTRKVQMNVF